MTAHLLVVSLGPVQDFIAAARRTRDLWFGSHLLSEISKAAALCVSRHQGMLIFPAPVSESDLNAGSRLSVANIILAELPRDVDPAEVGKEAGRAAQIRWEDFANEARRVASSLIDDALWNDQLADVIECYVAWVPLGSPQEYGEARRRLMRILAGRKALRDFRPTTGQARVPKSSLDGARASVLIRVGSESETVKIRRSILENDDPLAQRLRLSAGEELDVIGMTKRAATRETFPSVTRVAADPWLRGIGRDDGGEARQLIEQIAGHCRDAAFAAGTGRHYEGMFPYDGAVLFPARLASMLRERRSAERDSYDFDRLLSSNARRKLDEIRKLLDKLQHPAPRGLGWGAPNPYLAVLAADGDRMGRCLSGIPTAKDHRDFSQQLTRFAGAASHIVEGGRHHGCLIYSGGDDVLALLPVDTCLQCARELHEEFGGLLDNWKDDEGKSPTLSVGIAIGHFQESLEDLLEFARNAERAAKGTERDGIAVHLYPRGGVPVLLRSKWGDRLDNRLLEWADLHEKGGIPDKFAYDLRQLSMDYEEDPEEPTWERTALRDALQKDALLLIKRKASERAREGFEKAERLLAAVESARDARRIAEEIIVAAQISEIARQARGKAPAVADREPVT